MQLMRCLTAAAATDSDIRMDGWGINMYE